MRNVQVQVAQNLSTEEWTARIPEFGLTIGGTGDQGSICHSVAGYIASAKAAHHYGDAVVVASPAEDGITASIYTRKDFGVSYAVTTEQFTQIQAKQNELFESLPSGAAVCVIRQHRIDPRTLDQELAELYKKFRK